MGRIKRFPKELANQIAAGEVVERPASALKELIENAVDAGALRVDVVLEEGGKALLSVSDDGCGMDRQDLELSLEPHASSKIGSIEDLNEIRTLGFRGEALASISSVSDLEISSRTQDSAQGWRIRCSFGRLSPPEPVGRRRGTTVIVRDLFLEIPARRAFLKGARTEQGRCVKVVRQAAVAWPDIRFSVSSGSRELFRSSGSAKGRRRVVPLLGDAFLDSLMEVRASVGQGAGGGQQIELYGYLADPDRVRLSSRQVYFFINGRPATAPVLWRALNDALKGRLVKGQQPAAVLFLDLPPDKVDVNVHPAKLEVRFRHPDQIYRLVSGAVKEVLASRGHLPVSEAEYAGGAGGPGIQRLEARGPDPAPVSILDEAGRAPGQALAFGARTEEKAPLEVCEAPLSPYASKGKGEGRCLADSGRATGPSAPFKVKEADPSSVPQAIGQLSDSYILCQDGDALLILDQHAAHEAVIFKRLMEEASQSALASQALAFPQVVELDGGEISDMTLLIERLRRVGIEAEPFGEDQLILRAVTALLPNRETERLWLEGFLKEFASEFSDTQAAEEEFLRRCLSRLACRLAIKAGQRLDHTRMQALVEECLEEGVTNCPHGRPIWQSIPISELKKGFRRT
jgi:DNA mismatch repair protein MutL